MLSNSPKILVFAGPNGSGKSTVTSGYQMEGLYVNADEIKSKTGCTDMEAAVQAEKIRHLLLQKKTDFTFETVLSTERNLSLLQEAKEAGYQIMAVFVLTHDPEINVQRVKSRFAAGGHDVPVDKIISRYGRSLNNLAPLIRIADCTRVIDNSGDIPDVICEVNEGMAVITPNRYWTQAEILTLIYGR